MKTKKMTLTIIFSLLALIAAQMLSQVIASVLLVVKIPEFICNMTAGILYVGIAFWFIKLLCEKYMKDDMSNYYIPKFKVKIKWIVVAIGLPVLVTVCFLLLDGSIVENPMDLNAKLSTIAAGIFFTSLGAGVVEEMVFRGIIMNVLEKRFNKAVAIIIPSLLFGVVHILGQNFEILSCTLVVFAGTMVGIMFSLIASEEKSVWNSAIVHTIWNLVIIGDILSIGTAFNEYSLYSYILETKSFVLTGGEFGIESSVIAVAGYCLVSLFVVLSNRKKTMGSISHNFSDEV